MNRMNRISYVTIVVGLAWGDEGKGKVIHSLAPRYDMVCRWNGGGNAGHTIYVNGEKKKTHLVPSGIFSNKKSIIGPCCVLNVDKFLEEISYLKAAGCDTSLVKVSPKAHIITEAQIRYDNYYLKEKLGTTGNGIAPCYSDKMMRRGVRAEEALPKEFLWDGELKGKILCEGAQSVWLDIDHGNYPYVTSSSTLPYSACSLGFTHKDIDRVIGVAKIYDTKSGVDPDFPESLLDESNVLLNDIIREGDEFGTTTGRKRKVNWLFVPKLIKAINLCGCDQVIVNKCDILQKIGHYRLYDDGGLLEFDDIELMKNHICTKIYNNTSVNDVRFSSKKECI